MDDELERARATLAQQAEEIDRLRQQLAANRFADNLREALRLAATAGRLSAPATHSELLDLIVATAAQVISARAAALFLVDRERQELVFEVALGQRAAEARKFRVPLGSGVAGLVAATGQAMAISDAQHDPRHASDIAQRVGYQPQSILCVPLIDRDDVIGVLELLDKEGAPSFGPSDMAALSLFANQVAVAIQQSRSQAQLAGLLAEVLASANGGDGESAALREQLRAFSAGIEADASYEKTLELAQLLREIAQAGEPELQLCQTVVRGIAEYVRTRARGQPW
jgi:GAF domain-containing protein